MSEATSDMTNILFECMDGLTPIIDAADGLKANLEARGWSPTMAEELAGEWLRGAIAASWRVAK